MHTPIDQKHRDQLFALEMLFIGLSILLGLELLIQFGAVGSRMNADGIYSAAPVYNVYEHRSSARTSRSPTSTPRRSNKKSVQSVRIRSAESKASVQSTAVRAARSSARLRSGFWR